MLDLGIVGQRDAGRDLGLFPGGAGHPADGRVGIQIDRIARHRTIGRAVQADLAVGTRPADAAMNREIVLELVASERGEGGGIHLRAGSAQKERPVLARIRDRAGLRRITDIGAEGLFDDDGAGNAGRELVLVGQTHEAVALRHVAGVVGASGRRWRAVLALDRRIDAAKAELGVVSVFEQRAQRLRRAFDPARQQGRRAQQQGGRAGQCISHKLSSLDGSTDPGCHLTGLRDAINRAGPMTQRSDLADLGAACLCCNAARRPAPVLRLWTIGAARERGNCQTNLPQG